MADNPDIHPFETKGLGRAPYRFEALYETGISKGDPPCAIGRCAFCGKPIKINCIIASADDIRSAVGHDCVERIGDAALAKVVKREVSRRRSALLAEERVAATKKKIDDWKAKKAEQSQE
jgi:hypothetical protein